MSTTAIRGKTINLRATEVQKGLIKRAAETLGETYTTFMLDASMQRAESVLADRSHFELSDEQMTHFLDALDAPVTSEAALRALIERKPQWAH